MIDLFQTISETLASVQRILNAAVKVQHQASLRIRELEAENARLQVQLETLRAQMQAVGAFGFAPKKGVQA